MLKQLWTELLFIFRRVSQAEAIVSEMREAEHALLRAETGVEYAQALVTYNKQRIKRLKAYLATTDEPKETT